MKIIKKYKLPNQVCECCGCEVKISWRDLTFNHLSCKRNVWKCPLCKEINIIKFKEKENEETN